MSLSISARLGLEIYRRRSRSPDARERRGVRARVGPNRLHVFVTLSMLVLLAGGSASAQDWGSQAEEDWSQPATPASDDGLLAGWSVRAGVGFIDDPTALLLNIEVPYAFDRWVSAGPMFQVGLDDNNLIVAPTANVTLSIPDVPGEGIDGIRPFGLIGIGFAYIEDDNRRNDDSSAGFLIHFGVGVEYEINEHFFLGSQMMFNFLPEETLGQEFFYSWQVIGTRIAF